MEILNFIGGIASIIGLLVSIYTLIKVENLPSTLKQQWRDKQLSDLIDELRKIPASKPILTETTIRKIQTLVGTIRLYDVSKIPLMHKNRKALLQKLESELEEGKQLTVVLLQLQTIQNEITIR